MSEPNPYAPPESGDSAEAPTSPGFKELVVGWEKLRLIYNGLLLIPGIVVLILYARTGMPLPAVLIFSALFALAANIAFLLGPLTELYFTALFFHGTSKKPARRLIFSAGLLVSFGVILLAAVIAIGLA